MAKKEKAYRGKESGREVRKVFRIKPVADVVIAGVMVRADTWSDCLPEVTPELEKLGQVSHKFIYADTSGPVREPIEEV